MRSCDNFILIYNKTQYVKLQILPKPWKFYTIQDGVDGDILQVCPLAWLNTPGGAISKSLTNG